MPTKAGKYKHLQCSKLETPNENGKAVMCAAQSGRAIADVEQLTGQVVVCAMAEDGTQPHVVVRSPTATARLVNGSLTGVVGSQLPTKVNKPTSVDVAPKGGSVQSQPPGGTGCRHSNRSMAKNDTHSMLKAKRLAAARNLETPGNSNSFASFSDSRISSNLNNVGISLGRDDNVIN